MSYLCPYCGLEHDEDTASNEHIVPEALFNKNYVLKPVCKMWNHFMSFSFEQDMLRSKMFRELRLVFQKPTGSKRVGEVTDVSGQKYERYFENGREILKKKPSLESENTLTIRALARDGRVLEFELVLPFEIHRRVTGSTEMIRREKLNAKVAEQLESALDYVRSLADDASKRPSELADFLRANEAEMLRPKRGHIDFEWTERPAELVESLADERFAIDDEKARKFFLKIAWTHACKQLGRSALNGPFATFILEYIRSGWVREVHARLAPALFDQRTIEGHDFFLWSDSPVVSAEKCDALTRATREEIEPQALKRLSQFHNVRNLISFAPVTLDFDHSRDYPELRYHELELRHDSIRGVEGLCCRIALFGGTCSALVLLATEVPGTIPAATLISF